MMFNPYVMFAVAVAWLASVGYAGYWGMDYADMKHEREKAKEKAAIDQIREANREFADIIALETAEAIKKIRVQNRTINNEVRHEREVHHVLNDAACAVPSTTVGVLNRARAVNPSGSSASGSAPALPTSGATAGGQTPAARGSGAGGLGSGVSIPGVREAR